MGSKENFTGGYFVDSNDITGTKAQGRSTIINKVLYSGWASHVETAVYLTQWAHSVYPYRRQANGTMKQKLRKSCAAAAHNCLRNQRVYKCKCAALVAMPSTTFCIHSYARMRA